MKILPTCLIGATAAAAMTFASAPAQAGSDPFIGEIMMVGYTFCPRGWADANGQLLPIASYTALFSLYGTTYGGDGRTTFGLPDLRGRVAMHTGQGPGLSNRKLGQKGGAENVTGASGAQSIGTTPPYQVVRFCVALVGIYPSRN